MQNRDVYEELERLGKLEYGVTFEAQLLRDLAEINTVTIGTRDEFKSMELQELQVSGYIRDKLLNQGKYLKSSTSSYRVLLPSENEAQVMSFVSSANRKINRALKLNKNTPSEYKIPTQEEVRIEMQKKQRF